MTNQELLQSAHIPPELWGECLVVDGMIFVPEDNLTAQQVYDRFLNPPAEPPQEDLKAEIERLKPYEEGYRILVGEGGDTN